MPGGSGGGGAACAGVRGGEGGRKGSCNVWGWVAVDEKRVGGLMCSCGRGGRGRAGS